MVFSIITQFTGQKYAFDKKRNLKKKETPAYYVIGRDPAEKIFYGFLYWVFALGVDSTLSKKPLLEELRMPTELIHQLKEIVNLPFMKLIPDNLPENEKQFSDWIKKAFEQSVICDVEGEYHQFNILQCVKEFAVDAINHSIPVLINDCLFRGFYFLKKIAGIAKSGKINAIEDLFQIDPHDYLPFNNQVVAQMAVIASGTFVAVDLVHATIKTLNVQGSLFLNEILQFIFFF